VAETFYRVVKGNSPAREDFLSYADLGIVPEDDPPEARRLKAGISVNATLRQARNRARGVTSLRDHESIAELRIPDGAGITFERTGATRGHYTLWGSPEDLLACVVSVVRVDEVD
jgi:hypothetical protein